MSVRKNEALVTDGPAGKGFPRRIWAEVDLEAIRHNVRVMKEAVGPRRLFMACVKGDGYGHGMVPVARAALQGGADRLSVAHVEEGIELRRAGIEAPIQILIESLPEYAESLFEFELIPSLSSTDVARGIAARLPGRIKVHVEVDTGMGRVPLEPADAPAFLGLLDKLGCFEVEGLFSHFSCSHIPGDTTYREFTLGQLAAFMESVQYCEAKGWHIPIKHMASSGAVALYPEAFLDMVRPGGFIYGFRFDWVDLPIKPALTWKTSVLTVRPVARGVGIGYNQAYTPQRDTVIAIVAAGYADGYPRALSKLSHILIRGQRAPLVGLIAMDQMMADVGHIPGVSRGDEAVLIGKQGGESLNAVELACLLNTTPVIFTCCISKGVERVYLNSNF